MPNVARIIGGAGTGKTAHCMRIAEEWLSRGWVTAERLGYVSFTRAARREAAQRFSKISGVSVGELEQAGWIRTLHSVCYRQLGIGKELITDSKADRRWIAEAVGDEVDLTAETNDDEWRSIREGATEADNALALWHVARCRLEPLAVIHAETLRVNEFCPDLEKTTDYVERYEQAKRLDGRCDFTDILARFAGLRCSIQGVSETTTEGECPDLPIWFLDEWQDASALLDRVARRLTEAAQWVYVAGDGFQSIYHFGGSSPQHFMNWHPDKERILPQSYRCPRPIQELGERILMDCSDYWDRKIAPAPHAGAVEEDHLKGGWIGEVNPSQSWLLIARSNAHAHRLAKLLDDLNIPWLPTKGEGGRWNSPVRLKACCGLMDLEKNLAITAHEWTAALKYLPSKTADVEIIQHGMKAAWQKSERSGDDDATDIEHLSEWGAAPALIDVIRAGRWGDLIDHGTEFREAYLRWGYKAIIDPQVRVGTIHSVKGGEADHVALLTTSSRQCSAAMEYTETHNEELRVWYVAVTRARRRLIVLGENCYHKMELPL